MRKVNRNTALHAAVNVVGLCVQNARYFSCLPTASFRAYVVCFKTPHKPEDLCFRVL